MTAFETLAVVIAVVVIPICRAGYQLGELRSRVVFLERRLGGLGPIFCAEPECDQLVEVRGARCKSCVAYLLATEKRSTDR